MKLRAVTVLLAVSALTVSALAGSAPGAAAPLGTNASTSAADEVTTRDACFTWTRNLRRGDSGRDVRKLQIRLAGWVSRGEVLRIDGDFGRRTALAVKRFKIGYGIDNTPTGIAGPRVFRKLYRLQEGNCTPRHFDYWEFKTGCGNGFSGGAVSATKVRRNLRHLMWQLEAVRKKIGGHPITITSGFRCGSGSSRHHYGDAADIGNRLCQVWRKARTSGFDEILGPGYPDHNDHTHVANNGGGPVSASSC